MLLLTPSDRLVWLKTGKPLAEQLLLVGSKPLLLRRRLYFAEHLTSNTSASFWAYHEAHRDVLDGTYPTNRTLSVALAALQPYASSGSWVSVGKMKPDDLESALVASLSLT